MNHYDQDTRTPYGCFSPDLHAYHLAEKFQRNFLNFFGKGGGFIKYAFNVVFVLMFRLGHNGSSLRVSKNLYILISCYVIDIVL